MCLDGLKLQETVTLAIRLFPRHFKMILKFTFDFIRFRINRFGQNYLKPLDRQLQFRFI